MAFDDVLLKYVGECGLYQCLIVLLLMLIVTPESPDTMEMVYTQATPLFWPKGQNLSSYNVTHDDPCKCISEINGTLKEQPCTEWKYDDSVFESTLVTQFDLVCERAWLPSIASSAYMLSFMGVFPVGILSDRFGRRPCLIACVVLNVLSRVIQIWSPSVTVYIIARVLVGWSHMGRFTSAYVLASEFVGPSKRLITCIILNLCWVVGCFLIEGYAVGIRSRFYLEIVSTVLVACTLPFLWFVPESPRWLSSQGRWVDAHQILKKIAQHNGRELPPSDDETLLQTLESHTKSTESKSTNCAVLRSAASSRVLVLRTAILAVNWMSVALSYYGLTLNSGKLAGNIYLNTFLSTLMEVPGYIAVIVTLSTRSGRTISISTSTVLNGIFLLASVPFAAGTAATAFSLLGKLCVSYAFAAIYIYTCELFPTTIRNIGLGLCSLTGRIGSALAPIIISAFPDHVGAASLIGIVSLVTGLLVLCLPETRGTKLPQTIPEVEVMKSFLLSRCRQKEECNQKKTKDEEFTAFDVAT